MNMIYQYAKNPNLLFDAMDSHIRHDIMCSRKTVSSPNSTIQIELNKVQLTIYPIMNDMLTIHITMQNAVDKYLAYSLTSDEARSIKQKFEKLLAHINNELTEALQQRMDILKLLSVYTDILTS
jgi:hypothetical protein